MKKIFLILASFVCMVALAVPVRSLLGTKGSEYAESIEPPESAIVEYIENTGTQVINLGIASQSNLTIQIKVMPKGYSYGSAGFCGWIGNGGRTRVGILSGGGGKFYFNYGKTAFELPSQNYSQTTWYEIEASPQDAMVTDGVTVWSTVHEGWGYYGNIFLFGVSTGSNAKIKCRIGYCRVYFGDKLIRDLVPIRFINESGEQEGAMYDTISDTIFRNVGTDKFLFGKDVAPFNP